MKLIKSSAILLTAITCAASSTPVYAKDFNDVIPKTKTGILANTNRLASSASNPQLGIPNPQKARKIIPVSAAITIAFSQEMTVKANHRSSVILITTEPIIDEDGNEAVPARALVKAHFKPTKEGIEIVAESIVVRGRNIPLRASNIVIEGEVVTIESSKTRAEEDGQFGANLGDLIGNTLGLSPDEKERLRKAAETAGKIYGTLNARREMIVKIPQGSTYIFSVQSPTYLP
jgi:hypothetical protein